MPCIVLLDVMPGADGGFQLVSHHHAWSLGGWPANEKHHASPCVRECPLRKRQRELDFSGPIIRDQCTRNDYRKVLLLLFILSYFIY